MADAARGSTIVTGAAGFIGSHVAGALLAQGRRVIGIDNFDPFYDRATKIANIARIRTRAKPDQSAAPARITATDDFHLIEADIRDRERLHAVFAGHRPSSVFHLAALAGVRPSIAEPARYADVNVQGLVNVLDAARAVDCRTVVFASSSSVYGDNRKVPFAEDDAVDHPISPYAATKRAGELIAQSYAHLFQLRVAIVRLFTVYGPAQRPDLAIAKFMRLIAAGEEVPMFGDGSSSRDYTYVDDIVDGLLAAERVIMARDAETERRRDEVHAPAHSVSSSLRLSVSRPAFRIWNLGNSHPVTLAQMIDAIAAVVGKPARVRRLPAQPGDVERTWADLSRSQSELGYQPRMNLKEGVQQQWEWLRMNAGR